MQSWFIVSAIGRDRPGLVAELAELVYDADANLEDSRMTILGTDFAVILLASSSAKGCADTVARGAKSLERDHGLTIIVRALSESPRPAVPAAGTRLFRVTAAGEDKAGIVMGVCRVLAEKGVNVAELSSRNQPGPGGSPHYLLEMAVEVPESIDPMALQAAVDQEADRLVVDIRLEPA